MQRCGYSQGIFFSKQGSACANGSGKHDGIYMFWKEDKYTPIAAIAVPISKPGDMKTHVAPWMFDIAGENGGDYDWNMIQNDKRLENLLKKTNKKTQTSWTYRYT